MQAGLEDLNAVLPVMVGATWPMKKVITHPHFPRLDRHLPRHRDKGQQRE